eukprot:6832008-Alexandrium_andersonii.AAC.1
MDANAAGRGLAAPREEVVLVEAVALHHVGAHRADVGAAGACRGLAVPRAGPVLAKGIVHRAGAFGADVASADGGLAAADAGRC